MEVDQAFLCFAQVLKLHPTLTPVKVALDMGRGSSSELRQVPRTNVELLLWLPLQLPFKSKSAIIDQKWQ